MEWYRAEAGALRNRKILMLSVRLGCSPYEALGYVHALLGHVAQEYEDGDITAAFTGESEIISRAIGNDFPSLQEFFTVGLIERKRMGARGERVFIKGWKERNGRTLRERLRQQRSRKLNADDTRTDCATDRQTDSTDIQTDERTEEEGEALDAFVSLWNERPFTKCRVMTDKRLVAWRARMRDSDWVASWREALERISTSGFCLGKNERNWMATVDWFLRPGTLNSILEGQFDNRTAGDNTSTPAEDEAFQKWGGG